MAKPYACDWCGTTFMRFNPKRHCSVRCRFFDNVNPNGPVPKHRPELGACHVWTGLLTPGGYPLVSANGKNERATHIAWLLAEGAMPTKFMLHHCDNPACVNRLHLFEGDTADNVADRHAKGRDPRGDRNGSRRHPERLRRGEAHHSSKLTAELVVEARVAHAAGESCCSIARRMGVTPHAVDMAIKRQTWRHVA